MQRELKPKETGILVIDFQERLCDAMPTAVIEAATRNIENLLVLSQRLEIPVIVTEQYPKGLGPTIDPLARAMSEPRFAKTAFSAMRDDEARAAIEGAHRSSWIVAGMETHICVYQTVRDLLNSNRDVWVLGDGAVSRTKANWKNGLDLMRDAGATITSTEAALFDLLEEGRGDAFKEISRRIR
jgi:nicotinamidase-related amidase